MRAPQGAEHIHDMYRNLQHREPTHDPLSRLYGISTLRFVRDTSTLLYEAPLRVYLCQLCGVRQRSNVQRRESFS